MEPSTNPLAAQLPPKKRPLIVRVAIVVVALAVLAGVGTLVGKFVYHLSLENEVKTELIKQNKLVKSVAKENIYPNTLPDGVKTTSKVTIDAVVSASGTSYCIAGTSKTDPTIIYHMDNTTGLEAPISGSCSETATVAPSTPSGFAIGSFGAGVATLTWSQSPYTASYKVDCATDKIFVTNLTSKTATGTTVTMTDLKNTSYFCRLAAVNSVGQSAWTTSLKVETNPVSIAPTNLNVTTVSSSALHYSFDAMDGAQSYVVEYSTDDSFVKDVKSFTTSDTSGDVTNLAPYTAYYFHVKMVTAGFDADHATFSGEILGRTAK